MSEHELEFKQLSSFLDKVERSRETKITEITRGTTNRLEVHIATVQFYKTQKPGMF